MESLSASQFAEWLAYDKIEPIGEMREEIRHGQRMAMTANINRNKKEREEPFSAIEFMNFLDDAPEEEKVEESSKSISHRIKTELFRM